MNIGNKIDGLIPKLASGLGTGLSAAGGFISTFISGKMLFGMVAGVIALMGVLLVSTTKQRDAAVKTNNDIGNAVATAAGVDPTKFKIDQIIPTLLVITADRDTARRERDGFKNSAARQTTAIKAQAATTIRERKRADAAVVAAFKVSRQRDVWIGKAQVAAKRTNRLAADAELKQTEDTFNALYNAGF
jgi:hypothetical protein